LTKQSDSFIKHNARRRGNGQAYGVHPLYHRVNMTNGAEFGVIKDETRIHLHPIWKLSAAFCAYGRGEWAGKACRI